MDLKVSTRELQAEAGGGISFAGLRIIYVRTREETGGGKGEKEAPAANGATGTERYIDSGRKPH